MAKRSEFPAPFSAQASDQHGSPVRRTTHDQAWYLEAASRPLRVLVAEDSRAIQEIVKKVLLRRGHRVELVGNGREAVERVEQADFDVVLMDAHMPTMNGLQAAAAIRHGDAQHGGQVPIIAMTAHPLENSRQSCLEAGMDDYLSKPFDVAELVSIVESYGAGRPRGERDST